MCALEKKFWTPLLLPFSWHLFALFSSSKSALFCREREAQQRAWRAVLCGMNCPEKFCFPPLLLPFSRHLFALFPLFEKCSVTRDATTLNPKAGLGLQRWSARRQPVVQAQILVVQGLLCGNSSEKAPYYREKGPGVQRKKWPKYRYCFSCFLLRVVLYLLSLFCRERERHSRELGEGFLTEICAQNGSVYIFPFWFLCVASVETTHLVAQCSATPASVAATPPCSATPFQRQLDVRHSWLLKGGRCDRAF